MSDRFREKRPRKLEAIPVYKRIEQDIREKIQQGYWPTGALLPSRARLAKEYGVGLVTLEHAIEPLLLDGTLRGENGRGTFVTGNAPPSAAPATPAPRLLSPLDNNAERKVAIIGIVAADIPLAPPGTATDWTSRIISALERTLSSTGNRWLFTQRFTGPEADTLIPLGEAITHLTSRGANALAIPNVVNMRKVTEEILSVVDLEKIPVVLHSWENLTGPIPHVVYDQAYAGYKAAQHLLQAGYRPLVFLSDSFSNWWISERLRGAQAAVEDMHLPADTLLVYQDDAIGQQFGSSLDEVFAEHVGFLMGDLFKDHPLMRQVGSASHVPCGIIAPTDVMAYGFRRALRKFGILPGLHYGLVGFDDEADSACLGLTTMRPPLEEMGEEMAHLLFRTLHKQRTAIKVSMHSQLIVRSSTLSPASSANM